MNLYIPFNLTVRLWANTDNIIYKVPTPLFPSLTHSFAFLHPASLPFIFIISPLLFYLPSSGIKRPLYFFGMFILKVTFNCMLFSYTTTAEENATCCVMMVVTCPCDPEANIYKKNKPISGLTLFLPKNHIQMKWTYRDILFSFFEVKCIPISSAYACRI